MVLEDHDVEIDFDRSDYDALSRRLVPCTNSNIFEHALDTRKRVWWWSNEDEIWYLLDAKNEEFALASVDNWLDRARRFLKILPLYLRPGNPQEKDAAFLGLLRIVGTHDAQFGWHRNRYNGPWGHEVRRFYCEITSEDFKWLLNNAPSFDVRAVRFC
jgi:hypothetical protein